MHRGRISNDKPKNFLKAIKRLFSSIKKWHPIIILALFLAMISSIFALIAPNKLSDIANIITDGLSPNTKIFEEITTKISYNFTNQETLMKNIQNIMINDNISQEDKIKFQETMQNIPSLKDEEKYKVFINMPDSILLELLDEIKVNNIKISSEDQLKTLKIVRNIKPNNQKSTLKAMDKLPKKVYNLIEPKMNMNKIKNISLFLGIIYIISSVFNYIENISLAVVANRFAEEMRNNITDKINKLPLKYFDNHEIGDILSRITNDVDLMSQTLNDSLSTLVSALTLFIGSLIMMFYTNWIMAITAILSSFIGFILMGIIMSKSQKYFNKRQEELGKLNGHIEEIYSGHIVVQAYNGQESAIDEFDELNKNLFTCNQRSQFLSGLMPSLMGFIGNFGYVMVCIVGALLVMNGTISFGVIVAFMIYIRMFTSPLSQIAQATTRLQSTAAASERVFEFIDEEEMNDDKDKKRTLIPTDVTGNIEFKHVKFGYDEDKNIIKDFSAHATSGQKIALVGPTGAGKTTMVNLLMKFYEINDGQIIIDGVDIKELSRNNVHKLFTMVLQDTWLFEGTIRDNIKFNRENITDKQIWDALKAVGVKHFIETLPGGLDAKIDDSDSISSGQKQLLTIARGMIEDAPFLILDEATSNVDTRTEELVQKAMDKISEGKTSFIIAHRLSTIKNANLILVLNQGDIIEKGTHEELMKKKGFYADLYNSQFKKETIEVKDL